MTGVSGEHLDVVRVAIGSSKVPGLHSSAALIGTDRRMAINCPEMCRDPSGGSWNAAAADLTQLSLCRVLQLTDRAEEWRLGREMKSRGLRRARVV